MQVQTVTVIGANGTMGSNVSGIFASFGNAKVNMVCRDMDQSRKAIAKAASSVKADSVIRNMIPADYSTLGACVAESDIVFESVAERLDLKREVTTALAAYLKPGTIVCTGTSGLSITTLAESLPEDKRGQYFGVHMFNPPYSMTLCEVTPTKYSNRTQFEECKNYLRDILRRNVVEVKDSPAFLGNRIGFQFINEALQYADKYKFSGGIDYIDAILAPYTGRSMAPLVTSDFVGLDIHKAIVDNLYLNTHDYARETFVIPKFAQHLITEGKLGRKTNAGLYKTETYADGLKRKKVYDIVSDEYREKIDYVFPFKEKMIHFLREGNYSMSMIELVDNQSIEAKIALEFLLKYVIYSLSATEIVGYNIHDADDVMATGYNWCPPLAIIEALSSVRSFKDLLLERLDQNVLDSVDIEHILYHIEKSQYDFRVYFKAAK